MRRLLIVLCISFTGLSSSSLAASSETTADAVQDDVLGTDEQPETAPKHAEVEQRVDPLAEYKGLPDAHALAVDTRLGNFDAAFRRLHAYLSEWQEATAD